MSFISIIVALLPLVVPLIKWFLDRAQVSAETKAAFFEFIKKAGQDLGSVKLMAYGDAQLKWLKEHPWAES